MVNRFDQTSFPKESFHFIQYNIDALVLFVYGSDMIGSFFICFPGTGEKLITPGRIAGSQTQAQFRWPGGGKAAVYLTYDDGKF